MKNKGPGAVHSHLGKEHSWRLAKLERKSASPGQKRWLWLRRVHWPLISGGHDQVDRHPAENACRLSRFLMISGHRLTGPIHGRIVGVAEKHCEVVRFAGGGVDALCIAGVRRSRSTSSEVSLANVALERGISHITVRRRIARGHVCRREGIDGRVAYLIAGEV